MASAADREIRSFEDLLAPFLEARKGAGFQRIGMEAEKFGVVAQTGAPVQYEGACGILDFFRALVARHGWNEVRETDDGPVIALDRKGRLGAQVISLEPGAQFELSGAILETVHQVREELDEHLAEIGPTSAGCGVRWLACGYHPLARQAELPWVPKERYRIMREFFPQVGGRGLDMMRRTATVQVNLDYADEEDAMRKLRVSLKLGPMATAIFANGPFTEGRVNGMKTERAMVWLDTDPSRTGLLPRLLEPGAGFADYVEWALDAPMYLIKRDGKVIANTTQTFRTFWHEGREGHRARLGDWLSHLKTMFPEARLGRTLEVRGADSQPRRYMPAVAALWTGLLYDAKSLDAAERLVADLRHDEVQAMRPDVAKRGLAAELRGRPLRELAAQAVDLAMAGLERRARLDDEGRDERMHLQPIAELVGRGWSPADVLLDGLDPKAGDLRQQIVDRCAA
jgi:glutamate--cysteine ligase